TTTAQPPSTRRLLTRYSPATLSSGSRRRPSASWSSRIRYRCRPRKSFRTSRSFPSPRSWARRSVASTRASPSAHSSTGARRSLQHRPSREAFQAVTDLPAEIIAASDAPFPDAEDCNLEWTSFRGQLRGAMDLRHSVLKRGPGEVRYFGEVKFFIEAREFDDDATTSSLKLDAVNEERLCVNPYVNLLY